MMGIGIARGEALVVLIVIALMSIKVYRPFCKYLCPLGAIYGLFNPISSYRLVAVAFGILMILP
ncbi:MAG: 4Fe-4S binding protein [Butyrivibrio sp.]|nr:4Fe-4S binding protein [Butyrivibrio sp.]